MKSNIWDRWDMMIAVIISMVVVIIVGVVLVLGVSSSETALFKRPYNLPPGAQLRIVKVENSRYIVIIDNGVAICPMVKEEQK